MKVATAKSKKPAGKPQRPLSKVGKAGHKAASRSVPAPKPTLRPKVASRPVLKSKSAPVKLPLPAAKLSINGNGHTKPVASVQTKSNGKSTSKLVEPAIPPEKDISSKSAKGVIKDRIFLMVPDPHWLHAHWELSYQSVQRAEAALGQDWYGALPCIRLFDVTSQDTTSTAESSVRDIIIHGGCSHWYIDIPQPPRTYRADIGYITRRGHFHPICRSNVVTPPKAGETDKLDDSWPAKPGEDDSAKRLLQMATGFESVNGMPQIRELFDDSVRRTAKETLLGTASMLPDKLKKFAFDINAELLVYGRTDPSASVKLQNEPLKVRPDGTFTMRYSLTDGRQIIPAVATSSDGMEERTIILSIERNTKQLDPQVHDLYGERE